MEKKDSFQKKSHPSASTSAGAAATACPVAGGITAAGNVSTCQ